jgi:putative Mg2+ transporter-C (MgtC) family protein
MPGPLWSTADQWTVLLPVLLALVLSTAIGLEREAGAKAAGLRTHALVGLSAAVIMVISKYGFADLLGLDHIALDPSRIAAQIVSGIGFIGGGLIFVRRDAVRGLTTAAIVWMTAAIGMACGAGLVILALAATVGHFIVVFVYPRLARALPRSRYVGFALHVVYEDGRGILRDVLRHCTEAGFSIAEVTTHRLEHDVAGADAVAVELEVQGQPFIESLTTRLEDVSGVLEVSSRDLARATD